MKGLRGLAVCSLIALMACAHHSLPLHGTVMGGVAPELALFDSAGREFSFDATRGRVVVLFFGYTHCPDLCPTTLAHLAQAIHRLPSPDIKRILGVFVSVDPTRDTPAIIQRYVQLFDHDFIGLGGSAAALAAAEQKYHVWAQPLPAASGSKEYVVAHSSTLFLIDRSGHVAEVLPWNASVATLVADLRLLAEQRV